MDLQSHVKKIAGRNAIHFGTRIADWECNIFKKDFDDACLLLGLGGAVVCQFKALSRPYVCIPTSFTLYFRKTRSWQDSIRFVSYLTFHAIRVDASSTARLSRPKKAKKKSLDN